MSDVDTQLIQGMKQLFEKWSKANTSGSTADTKKPKKNTKNRGKKNESSLIIAPQSGEASVNAMQTVLSGEDALLTRWRLNNPCHWCLRLGFMVRMHKFMGKWPPHLAKRYDRNQSLWTAIRSLANAGKPLVAIANSLEVDVSGWEAMEREQFLIKVLAAASGLPPWSDTLLTNLPMFQPVAIEDKKEKVAPLSVGPMGITQKMPAKKGGKKKVLRLAMAAEKTGSQTQMDGADVNVATDSKIDEVGSRGKPELAEKTATKKPPGFNFNPAQGADKETLTPPLKSKKWRTQKVTELDPLSIDKRVCALEGDVKEIQQDIHQINETKNSAQSLLMLLLEGQGAGPKTKKKSISEAICHFHNRRNRISF